MGFMSFLGIVQIILLWFTISTLSSVRAYVGGEALWSKSQKDALYHLQKYGQNKNRESYAAFLEEIKVPLGDRKSRIELEKENPDFNIARQGFLEGRNHPDDIEGLINTFIRFRHVYYIDRSIQIWTEADHYIDQLINVGAKLDSVIMNSPESTATIYNLSNELRPLNQKLTTLEDEFTYTLGEGSRWLSNLVMKLLIGVAVTVALIVLTQIFLINRSVERDIEGLIQTAKEIAKGNFNYSPRTYSNYELKLLDKSMNYMSKELKRNIQEREDAQETMRQAKETAEELLQIQEQFLANTSHEIRTPINGVIGMARQLTDTSLNVEQKEFVQAITESSANLLHVVNDILDLSKIRAGKIVFERTEFRLSDLFKNLQFTLQFRADEKNIYLKFVTGENVPEVLFGDSVRLNQVLLNVVGNAIKFTEKGGVTISANLVKKENDYAVVQFSVTDTGIGISEDKLDYIFETFTQAEAHTTRKYGGTGLGLNIAKSLIEKQGGTINVTSAIGHGSKFYFELPFEIGSSKWTGQVIPIGNEIPNNVNLSNVSVLLIEDNLINQRIVMFDLGKWKVNTDVADNAEIGIEMLRHKKYDIILMDISMPGMDGLDATRYVRSQFSEPVRSIPIIAMTASAFAGEKEKCFEAGMSDYISKPYNVKLLYSMIVKWAIGEESEESVTPNEMDGVNNEEDENVNIIKLSSRENNSNEKDDLYIKEIVSLYIQAMPGYLIELNRYKHEKNWEKLKKIAHKMKGMVCYFGFEELTHCLNEIESLQGIEHDIKRLDHLLEKVNSIGVSSFEDLKGGYNGLRYGNG